MAINTTANQGQGPSTAASWGKTPLDPKFRCIEISIGVILIVGTVAGAIITALGALDFFGSFGSTGFLIAMGFGSGTAVFGLGGLLALVLIHCCLLTQEKESTLPNPAIQTTLPPVTSMLPASSPMAPVVVVPQSLQPVTTLPLHQGIGLPRRMFDAAPIQNPVTTKPVVQQTRQWNNCIDIQKEAPRFFFRSNEQHVIPHIISLVDSTVHEYMTGEGAALLLRSHVQSKGFICLKDSVLEHPQLDGWIMKGGGRRARGGIVNTAGSCFGNHFDNILRVFMAERMAQVVAEEKLDIVIPEKRLFVLPSQASVPASDLQKKYLVFSKKIDIMDEQDAIKVWHQFSAQQQRKIAQDICLFIKKTGYMDAHLGNIRWSASLQKVVIVDTESHGLLKEANDPSRKQMYSTINQCALIGLQELKNRVGQEFPIFAQMADIAMDEIRPQARQDLTNNFGS